MFRMNRWLRAENWRLRQQAACDALTVAQLQADLVAVNALLDRRARHIDTYLGDLVALGNEVFDLREENARLTANWIAACAAERPLPF